ncbi:MAG: hypothetical protein QOJ99_2486 [Bryobacterales bacterium]|jgi:hypothetical protein|nr:hypothetical protein [Bryobacterales bacterium]
MVLANHPSSRRSASAGGVRALVRRRRQRKRPETELPKKSSLLDFVTEDIAPLQKKLGSDDRGKVTQYLDTVREVERRIQKAEAETSGARDLDRPLGVPAAYADHAKLMFDLQVLALQSDVTRVITFQLARETCTRTYPEIGVPDPHHPLTHNAGDPEKLARVAMINAFHVSLFAYFLQKLKSTPDGNGTLLDHTMYMYGSGMGNPDVHDHVNLPLLVAGGGAGSMKGGRHIRHKEPTPLANVHLTLLEKVGARVESFADSQGKVPELLSLGGLRDPICYRRSGHGPLPFRTKRRDAVVASGCI